MADDIDAKVTGIKDTVKDLHLSVTKDITEMKCELKAMNKPLDTLCTSLDGYAKSSEERLLTIEHNLGNRIPDDPDVYSQLQTLQAYKRKTIANGKAVWAFLVSLLLLGVSQVATFFGKGD